MFALPSGYVAAQDAGKKFAAEYYGRLNASTESVVGMFTERSQYYSMDSLNGRPAVGRVNIVREVRRFSGTYSGGRRFVHVVTVDAQIDDGHDGGLAHDHLDRDSCTSYGSTSYGSTTSYESGNDGSDNDGSDNGGSDNGGSDNGGHDQHLAVFVRAEWTDPARPSLAPLPFVQTFRVRCLRAADHGYRFKIVITIVKTMAATVQPPSQRQQLQSHHRRPDASRKGSINSGRRKNDYKTPIIGQFKQKTNAGHRKHLNAEAREFELRSDAMLPPDPAVHSSDDDDGDYDEQEPSDGDEHLDKSNEPWWIHEDYLDYRDRVKAFLEEPAADLRRLSVPAVDTSSSDDEAGPTNLLHVDSLDKSITADQLYAAFGRYGKVLWVRVLPGGYTYSCPSGAGHPYHSARVCFDRTESVDRAIADHRGPGCTISGVRVSFRKPRPGQ